LSSQAALERPANTSFVDALRDHGFSVDFIDSFFRPWFGGITLDRSLLTDASFCKFVFRCLARGHAALPALGMGVVAEQLAGRLRPGTLRLGARVTGIEDSRVRLQTGEVIDGSMIIVATEGPEAGRLLSIPDAGSKSVTCLWFAASTAPYAGPWLALNGESEGLINNLAVMTNVAPGYSSDARALISATILGPMAPPDDLALRRSVLAQLHRWFGPAVDEWTLVRVDRIPHAQPVAARAAGLIRPGLYVAGDHTQQPSAHGALLSGRLAAEAVLAQGEPD